MIEKKSICFFSPYSGQGNISGVQVRLEMLAGHLSELGHTVHIVGPYGKVQGAEVHHFSLDIPLWRRPIQAFVAGRIIRRLNPSVVILEGPALLTGMGGTPVIQMIHDSKFATSRRRRGGWALWLYYFIMCRVYSSIMTVSRSERARIASSLGISASKIIVSYNGIGEKWLAAPTRKDKDFDLLYVSNFATHKGHIRLLKCIEGTDYRVAFVGGDLGVLDDVKDYASIKGLNVEFYHNLSEPSLINIYDRAKVFVFPSELEGFGIPYLEACARRLPVVASDIDVFRELAAALGGQTVDFGDSDAVRSAIADALVRGPQDASIGQFEWKHQAEHLLRSIFAETGGNK